MSVALVWFRRDLRLRDNPALSQALTAHDQVIPLYIHAPHEEAPWSPGGAACWWLHHSLAALAESLHRHGSRLLLRQGDSLAVLLDLVRTTGASAVYWNRLYEPAAIARDSLIKTTLRETGITVESDNAALLWEPWTVFKDDGTPYQVFTRYWQACLRVGVPPPPLPVPPTLKPPPTWPDGVALATFDLLPRSRWDTGLAAAWTPGETAALARLATFCADRLRDYRQTRNLPGVDGVSRLSPYLHWGELSPRQIWSAVSGALPGSPFDDPGGETYLRELGWREFACYVLYHWPHTPDQPLQARFADYPWRDDDYSDLLAAWQRGRTGYPLVDAGMRELWQTGWMHNRVRMVVASWLTKNCRIPWQVGARWFWDTLVDADLASNTLGWQWTAGCGTDAAPYFRIFNPIRQSEQFDADGVYLCRWLPELAGLDNRWRHTPWALPADEQRRGGFTPGRDYPLPQVDLEQSRAAALQGFERIKNPPAASPAPP
jgi:deoxyribodipyrimidine photo-lyase